MTTTKAEERSKTGRDEKLEQIRKAWSVFFLLLVAAAFIVPYTLLAKVPRFNGAFLFWFIFAVLAIAAVGIITARWRD